MGDRILQPQLHMATSLDMQQRGEGVKEDGGMMVCGVVVGGTVELEYSWWNGVEFLLTL